MSSKIRVFSKILYWNLSNFKFTNDSIKFIMKNFINSNYEDDFEGKSFFVLVVMRSLAIWY